MFISVLTRRLFSPWESTLNFHYALSVRSAALEGAKGVKRSHVDLSNWPRGWEFGGRGRARKWRCNTADVKSHGKSGRRAEKIKRSRRRSHERDCTRAAELRECTLGTLKGLPAESRGAAVKVHEIH